MRRSLIVGNWKMNTSFSEAVVLTTTIKKGTEHLDHIEVVLCPPFVWLLGIKEALRTHPPHFSLGAQDVYFEDEGAFTGEISSLMLKGLCRYVILGHSERRRLFGETDEIVNKKIKACLRSRLTPIVAVGEKKRLDLEHEFESEVKRLYDKGNVVPSLLESLKGLDKEEIREIVIAYEPIWAIGTNSPATGIYVNFVCDIIRKEIAKNWSEEVSQEVRILYGGSVDSTNAYEILHQPEIDGVLVGGASLKTREFLAIAKAAALKPDIRNA